MKKRINIANMDDPKIPIAHHCRLSVDEKDKSIKLSVIGQGIIVLCYSRTKTKPVLLLSSESAHGKPMSILLR